jgi:hypothetical protein
MMKNKNLKNLILVFALAALAAIGCSSPEPERPKTGPRRAERNRPETDLSTNSGNNNTTTMTNTETETVDPTDFKSVLKAYLKKRNMTLNDIHNEADSLEARLLADYGAVFLTKAVPPPAVMFKSDAEVDGFQTKAGVEAETMAGARIELQPDAMRALVAAQAEATGAGLKITPRDGSEAGRRRFKDTFRLWKSRFDPAIEYWKKKGKLTEKQIADLRALAINDQVKAVLELEKQQIFFNTFFNASILYSVAAPGTSQHLSMLAFDANEFGDPKIREIMGKHGWFRTVQGDAPHFTFLGVKPEELKNLGLKMIENKDGEFWIPSLK